MARDASLSFDRPHDMATTAADVGATAALKWLEDNGHPADYAVTLVGSGQQAGTGTAGFGENPMDAMANLLSIMIDHLEAVAEMAGVRIEVSYGPLP